MTRLEEWNARVEAANAVAAKFMDREFRWGKYDCVRLAAALVKQRGHGVNLTSVGGYETERGALRALKHRGFSSLLEAMDAQGFPRIAPAMAWPGDIVALAAPDPWIASLTVKLSGADVLGSIEGLPFCALKPLKPVAAWRID